MVCIVVVLAQSLSDFSCGCTNHRIEVHIVVRSPAKSLDTDSPLLQLARVAKQGLFNGIREQHRVALAVREQWVRKETVQLLTNRNGIRCEFRSIRFLFGLWRRQHFSPKLHSRET